jgi:signal transduction histidine kinase
MPRRSVRSRFTALYGGLFLLSAVGLLALTNLLGTSSTAPAPPPEPTGSPLANANAHIADLEQQLATVQDDQARQLLVGSGIALLVMAVVSVVLGRVVAGRVLRPLRTITAATRRITADNLHERLAVTGPADEVKALADTVDDLLGRLEGAFAAQRRFVANASHELRTPLTTMRASLDVAVAKPEPVPAQTVALADRLRTELDRVDDLLEGFLTLARAQHNALPDRAPVRLGELVSAALDARAAAVELKRLTVEVTGTDTGTAVPGNPTLVAGLAEPFRRLGTDRTGSEDGSGLGLSIVAAIAAAHGGRLDLHARGSGGLRLAVALPP